MAKGNCKVLPLVTKQQLSTMPVSFISVLITHTHTISPYHKGGEWNSVRYFKRQTDSHLWSHFTAYCFNCSVSLLVTASHLLLCPIYKLTSIVVMCACTVRCSPGYAWSLGRVPAGGSRTLLHSLGL